jgi:hypothetical protein
MVAMLGLAFVLELVFELSVLRPSLIRLVLRKRSAAPRRKTAITLKHLQPTVSRNHDSSAPPFTGADLDAKAIEIVGDEADDFCGKLVDIVDALDREIDLTWA